MVINIFPPKQQGQLIWLFHELRNSSHTEEKNSLKIPQKILESLPYQEGAPRLRQRLSPDRRSDLVGGGWGVELNVHIGCHRVLSRKMFILKFFALSRPIQTRVFQPLVYLIILHFYHIHNFLEFTSKSKEGRRSLDRDRLPEDLFLDRRRPFQFQFHSDPMKS